MPGGKQNNATGSFGIKRGNSWLDLRAMRKLSIPAPLKEEFSTIEAIWHSTARTRRVDALLLAWVKHEKQLRRLFCFVVFQHSDVSETKLDSYIEALTARNAIYPYHFMRGFKAISGVSISDLIGSRSKQLSIEIERIRKYRNKFIHGMMAETRVNSRQIERDVMWLVEWVSALANGADRKFGYNGLDRGTYSIAKASPGAGTEAYPFRNVREFKEWIDTDIAPTKKPKE